MADVNAERLSFAARWAGLRTMVVDPTDDPTAAVQAMWDGDLPTLVMDATGNAGSMARTISLAAHGGRIVFVGLVQGDITFSDPEFHRRELTLSASRNATRADVDATIALLEEGTVSIDAWLTDRCTLDDAPSILPLWASGPSGTIKGLIEVS